MRCYFSITLFVVVSVHLCASNDVADDTDAAVKNGMLDFGVTLQSIFIRNNVENKNVLFSPLNIYTALALIHLGTNGTTRDEIANVMGMPQIHSPETLHEVLQNISLSAQNSSEKRSQLENGTRGKVKVCDLNLASGIFVQNGINLKKTYVENAKSYYDSEVFNVDFVNKGTEATDTINKYIANKTENRIKQLFKESLSPNTRVILTSSLYFKSLWLYKFNRTLTQMDHFHSVDGTINVPTMKRFMNTPYADLPSLGVETIGLKFADPGFCMMIVLPYENRSLSEFLSNLTSDHIRTIVNETTREHRVDLKIPVTAFKWSKSIKEELAQLGLTGVFNDGADLRNMMDRSNIKVDQISHSTDIKINEDGTEASAVTPIVMVLKIGGGDKPAKFHVNRPFFFFIYNRRVDTVLFYGTVYRPSGN